MSKGKDGINKGYNAQFTKSALARIRNNPASLTVAISTSVKERQEKTGGGLRNIPRRIGDAFKARSVSRYGSNEVLISNEEKIKLADYLLEYQTDWVWIAEQIIEDMLVVDEGKEYAIEEDPKSKKK